MCLLHKYIVEILLNDPLIVACTGCLYMHKLRLWHHWLVNAVKDSNNGQSEAYYHTKYSPMNKRNKKEVKTKSLSDLTCVLEDLPIMQLLQHRFVLSTPFNLYYMHFMVKSCFYNSILYDTTSVFSSIVRYCKTVDCWGLGFLALEYHPKTSLTFTALTVGTID